MLGTMVIESTLAIYTVWRYKMTPITRLIALILIVLAIFQLTEYGVCAGLAGLSGQDWSRLGFVAITALPPLGLHALHIVANKPKRWLIRASYATMAVFTVGFLALPAVFNNYQCTGNYVIFNLQPNFDRLYGIYYSGLLFTAVVLAVYWANQFRKKAKEAHATLQTLQAMILSYLVFLIPVNIVTVMNPAAHAGTPSIMCGFAVLMALILGFYILPRIGEPK